MDSSTTPKRAEQESRLSEDGSVLRRLIRQPTLTFGLSRIDSLIFGVIVSLSTLGLVLALKAPFWVVGMMLAMGLAWRLAAQHKDHWASRLAGVLIAFGLWKLIRVDDFQFFVSFVFILGMNSTINYFSSFTSGALEAGQQNTMFPAMDMSLAARIAIGIALASCGLFLFILSGVDNKMRVFLSCCGMAALGFFFIFEGRPRQVIGSALGLCLFTAGTVEIIFRLCWSISVFGGSETPTLPWQLVFYYAALSIPGLLYMMSTRFGLRTPKEVSQDDEQLPHSIAG